MSGARRGSPALPGLMRLRGYMEGVRGRSLDFDACAGSAEEAAYLAGHGMGEARRREVLGKTRSTSAPAVGHGLHAAPGGRAMRFARRCVLRHMSRTRRHAFLEGLQGFPLDYDGCTEYGDDEAYAAGHRAGSALRARRGRNG